MNVLLLGATGGTGRALLAQALDAGHSVTAYLRSPDKLGVAHRNLTLIQGDVFDSAAVIQACEGQDAALVALGGKPKGPHPCAAGTLNAVLGLQKHGGTRLIALTSLGVGDSRGEAGWAFEQLLVPLLLKEEMADKDQQEQVVRSSGLEWVIARPGGLTNSPASGNYHAEPHHPPGGTPRISRANVAAFMVEQLESDKWLHQAVALWE